MISLAPNPRISQYSVFFNTLIMVYYDAMLFGENSLVWSVLSDFVSFVVVRC